MISDVGIKCVAAWYALCRFSASSTSLLVSQVSVLTRVQRTSGDKYMYNISLGKSSCL